jgi:hypothetical protein
MKKEIRQVRDDGTCQITSVDERFYAVPSKDPVTELPIYEYYPSASWVAGYYYQGKGLQEWLKKNGSDADQILLDAGSRGNHIHHAIEMIIAGEELSLDTPVFNGKEGESYDMTTDEWEAIKSFVDWNNEVKPKYILSEKNVISRQYRYAGTIDCLAEINGELYLIDFKTSKSVYTSHIIQVSSYKQALSEEQPEYAGCKLAILQVGYAMNKKKWKWTEVDDKFALFQHTYAMWQEENPTAKPRQIDLPMKLGIKNPLKKEETVKAKKSKV